MRGAKAKNGTPRCIIKREKALRDGKEKKKKKKGGGTSISPGQGERAKLPFGNVCENLRKMKKKKIGNDLRKKKVFSDLREMCNGVADALGGRNHRRKCPMMEKTTTV